MNRNYDSLVLSIGKDVLTKMRFIDSDSNIECFIEEDIVTITSILSWGDEQIEELGNFFVNQGLFCMCLDAENKMEKQCEHKCDACFMGNDLMHCAFLGTTTMKQKLYEQLLYLLQEYYYYRIVM